MSPDNSLVFNTGDLADFRPTKQIARLMQQGQIPEALSLYGGIKPKRLTEIQRRTRMGLSGTELSFRENAPWVQPLFQEFLPDEAPLTVCLGVGDGIELVELREAYPEGHLVGIDEYNQHEDLISNARMQIALIRAMGSGARLLRQDFTQMNPHDMLQGYERPLVIVRNIGPLFGEGTRSGELYSSIPEWIKAVRAQNGSMVLTAQSSLEAVVGAMFAFLADEEFIHAHFNQGMVFPTEGKFSEEQCRHYASQLGGRYASELGLSLFNQFHAQSSHLYQSDSHVIMIGQ